MLVNQPDIGRYAVRVSVEINRCCKDGLADHCAAWRCPMAPVHFDDDGEIRRLRPGYRVQRRLQADLRCEWASSDLARIRTLTPYRSAPGMPGIFAT